MFRQLTLSALLALATLAPAWADDFRQPRRYDERPRARHRDDRTVWRYDVDGGGSFEKQRGDRWVQYRNDYKTPLQYRETDRTRDYVELYDAGRRLYVRLYDDQWYQRDPYSDWGAGAAGRWD
jgi:hypothetical protein